MKRYHKAMELFWLFTALFTAAFCVYIISQVGFKEGWFMLGIPLVAGVMYGMRRSYRKRMDNDQIKK